MIFKFEPIYQERVWGGNMLSKHLGREIPNHLKIGESWDIVDRENLSSKVSNHPEGKFSLRELIERFHENILGPQWNKNRKFPILIKWLDCSERLSLQVHPPTKIAKSINGEPKTENWYIAYATDEAAIFAGLRKGTTRAEFEKAIKTGTAQEHCHRLKSETGMSLLVESGRLHAIDAGNLILEIQQNSDTTYRVFDWGRKDLNGKSRELHIEESIKSINFDDFEPSLLETIEQNGNQTIAECEEFRIRKYNLNVNEILDIKSENEDCMLIHNVKGRILVDDFSISMGEHGLSPFSDSCSVRAVEESTILITDKFTRYSDLN